MSRFSLAAESELRKMGWYPGRRVDDAQLEQWSCVKFEDSAGYLRIHPKAFHFLREFGGLRCDVERPGETCYREKFEINPDVEYSSGIFWFANELTLNENLFPIGFVEYSLIMMGASGRFYGTGDGGLFVVAQTIEEGIESLTRGLIATDLDNEQERMNAFDDAEIIYRAVCRVEGTQNK
jgi:hypothetical protein